MKDLLRIHLSSWILFAPLPTDTRYSPIVDHTGMTYGARFYYPKYPQQSEQTRSRHVRSDRFGTSDVTTLLHIYMIFNS